MGTSRAQWRAQFVPVAAVCAGLALLAYALSAFTALPRLLGLRRECRMSYMMPNFVQYDKELREFHKSDSPLLHKYSLYLYRESRVPWNSHRSMRGSVLPTAALFIPGNAGSYAQVRSMASSAALQYWKVSEDRPVHDYLGTAGPVDWWTLDFNEDLSAFHGQTLEDQAHYVNLVLRFLNFRYPTPATRVRMMGENNGTVPLIGHSMGGIVARLALCLDNHPPSTVDTVLTLATPHAYPPVPFDRSVEQVYARVNGGACAAKTEHGPVLISLAGGLLDTQLPSDASSLTLGDVHGVETRLSLYTSAVSSLWSAVDHVAMVWCDQLRYKVAKVLLLDRSYFGQVFEPRNTPEARVQRRRLWSLMFGAPLEAEEVRAAGIAMGDADRGPKRLRDATPTLDMDFDGSGGVLRKDPLVHFYQTVSPPGPAFRYDGSQSLDDEALAFELVTNLAVGPATNVGIKVPQELELAVLACARAPRPEDPLKNQRATCQMFLPNAFEMLPLSPREPYQFPDATVLYDAPGYSFRRLRLSAKYLRMHRIETIRVEQYAAHAAAADKLGNTTVLEAGFLEDRPLPLRGAPGWLAPRHWALPGVDRRALLSFYTQRVPTWTWHAPALDAALLAYQVELEPRECARGAHVAGAPMLRAVNLATSDARFFPSLSTDAPARFILALHGSAPFMPPSERGVLLQLWAPTFGALRDADGPCSPPYSALRIRVHWRASAALLVMRYRLGLLAWPAGITAAACAAYAPATPLAALARLARPGTLAALLAAPLLLQLALRALSALPFRSYAYGIGTVDLRFWWLGPALMLASYALALLVAAVLEAGVRGAAAAHRRIWRTAAPELRVPHLPSRAQLAAWAVRRSTLLGGAVLLGTWLLLPFQTLTLVCFLVLAWTAVRAHAGAAGAATAVTTAPRLEAHLVSMLRLFTLLFWMLPLHAPVLAVWVRNVNAGWRMGFSRTEHSVVFSAPLLATVYAYAAGYDVAPYATRWTRGVTRLALGTLAATSLVYGIRFTYTQYDAFLLLLYWEVAQLVWRSASTSGYVPLQGEAFGMAPVLSAEAVPPTAAQTIPLVARAVEAASLPAARDEPDATPIDHLLERYLDEIDAYGAARARASTALSQGFAQLARARMALGRPGAVGRDHYDERMRARIRVDLSGRNALLCPGEQDAEAAGAAGFDPLYQFSGLPPPALRTAQCHFHEALARLVDQRHLAVSGQARKKNDTRPGAAVVDHQRRLAELEAEIRAARRAA